MSAPFGSYTVQAWKGTERVHDDIAGLSIDAAREIARTAAWLGHTGRIVSESEDYCEVYTSETMRCGTFAETTFVAVPREALEPQEGK